MDDVASNICLALKGGDKMTAVTHPSDTTMSFMLALLRGKGLHSFTFELNSSTFGTHLWVTLGYVGHKDSSQVELKVNECKSLLRGDYGKSVLDPAHLLVVVNGRGSHSSTIQLNLRHFGQTSPCPPV